MSASRNYGHTGRIGDPITARGRIEPMDIAPGFVAAVYRNPLLWGAAIAFAVSGILGMITL